ncbi:TPA: hypothetical protein N0F65_006162 [Lagenidium giganteum]|uniref:Uncharacterized protein n=1 Tax=Lagenidium giganteum TaxID=4803 RepID=A0AAV2Z6F3_9STRA|nr:TPA: hypothetical protein N0F65_006162 [Lagenidium giganteum]
MKDSKTEFTKHSQDGKGDLLIDKITPRWIQVFMEKHRIVLRAQTGKKQVFEEKMRQIKVEVARSLGVLQRGLGSGELNEDTIENIDETHFMIDFHTGKTFGFVDETSIKYADVVSGGEGMPMVVRITGGSQARIMPPMMIFQNATESYPIRQVTDDARKWNAKKFELIKDDAWQMTVRKDGTCSDKLKNPGKRYFLQLAAECDQELNTKPDKHGFTFARKVMIRCGMSLDVAGKWKVSQLYPQLQ